MSRHHAWIVIGLAAACLVPSSARAQEGEPRVEEESSPRATPGARVEHAEGIDGQREEERARLRHLLDMAAESARDKRISDGVGALAAGVSFAGAGVASWVAPSEPDAREARDVLGGVFVGVGGLMLAGGTYALSTRSAMEEQRDAYLAALGGRPDTIDAAFREAEGELFAQEKAAKAERTTTAVVSFVFGAAEIVGGIALVAEAKDPGLQWLGGGLIAGGVGAGILGVGALVVRSEEERIADLWRRERALSTGASRARLTIAPRLGVGSIGLTGTF